MDFFANLIINFFPILIVLSLAALATMFSERVGIVNIGINGVMIIGAVFFAIFAHYFGGTNPWMNLVIIPLAGGAGLLFNMLHGLATIKLKANHVISGVAINALGLGLALILMRIIGQSSNNARQISYEIPELAMSISTQTWENVLSLKLFILIGVVIAALIALNLTRWGLRYKAVGENPQAVDVAGISVNKIKWQGIMISGFLGGLSGAIFSQYQQPAAFNGTVNGLGFLALAIMIMGQWKITYIVISAIGFSLIERFSNDILFTNDPNLISWRNTLGSGLSMLPYIVTIIVLAIFSKKSRGPKAAGENYDKGKR